VYFLTPEKVQEQDDPERMSCCKAAQLLFGDLSSQGVATPGVPACDDTGEQHGTEHSVCDAHGQVKEDSLQTAKETIQDNAACFTVLDDVVQNERQLTQFPPYVADANQFFPGMESSQFRSIVDELHTCWLRFLPSKPLHGVPQMLCTAFDAWISRTMWATSPSLATKFYSECVQSRGEFSSTCGSRWNTVPSPDDRTYAHAHSILCDAEPQQRLLLQAHANDAGLPEAYHLDAFCGKAVEIKYI
jgi:hypothetical protein